MFSFIENVFQCSQMSSELRTELNHKRSTNEILELYLIMNCNVLNYINVMGEFIEMHR